ncbi:hypothetical protein J1614_011575 [Plenodomus biglobosus]|nr:hypothetical protein J1614_011575 [Plenodomus biglobosus]
MYHGLSRMLLMKERYGCDISTGIRDDIHEPDWRYLHKVAQVGSVSTEDFLFRRPPKLSSAMLPRYVLPHILHNRRHRYFNAFYTLKNRAVLKLCDEESCLPNYLSSAFASLLFSLSTLPWELGHRHGPLLMCRFMSNWTLLFFAAVSAGLNQIRF